MGYMIAYGGVKVNSLPNPSPKQGTRLISPGMNAGVLRRGLIREKERHVNIKTLQHCGLVVRDLERSRWFYGTVLGMQEIPRPSNFTFGGAWFQGGDSQLHLILASDT